MPSRHLLIHHPQGLPVCLDPTPLREFHIYHFKLLHQTTHYPLLLEFFPVHSAATQVETTTLMLSRAVRHSPSSLVCPIRYAVYFHGMLFQLMRKTQSQSAIPRSAQPSMHSDPHALSHPTSANYHPVSVGSYSHTVPSSAHMTYKREDDDAYGSVGTLSHHPTTWTF
jgi:hypothetical protein